MKTILFQGDSITDAGRVRDSKIDLGRGYPKLVAAKLGYDNPDTYTFINKGISGDRIVDVYARMKRDILNLEPDYMSILIGVNDFWHDLLESKNGVSTEKFEKIYTMLLEEIFAELPNLKVFIMGAYVLPGTATDEHYDEFRPEVEARAAAAKRVAEKFGLLFIDLQAKFDEAYAKAEKGYWTQDGVHPTTFGHELIARAWVEAFEAIK